MSRIPGGWRHAAASIAAALVLSAIAGAQAQHRERRRPLEATAPFWREVTQPGCARGRALLVQALRILADAERPQRSGYAVQVDPIAMQAAYESAIERLARAQRHCPRNPEVSYWLGHSYSQLAGRERADARRHEAARNAIVWLEHTLELEAEFEPEDVWFEIGIARTRLRDFGRAAEAYRRSIAEWIDERAAPTTYGNLAEVTMLAGDLDGAVRWYGEAVTAARAQGDSTELAEWGLAVALDRLGEHEAAVAQAWRAMSQRGQTLDALDQPYVFFEPEHEKDWYVALGHLARAQHGPPDLREGELDAAVLGWLRFIDGDGGQGPFAAIARDRLQRTRTALGQLVPAPRRGTAPGRRGR